MILHNSREEKYRFPFGAVPCKSTVRLSLTVKVSQPVSSAEVIVSTEGGMEQRIVLSAPEGQGEDYYANIEAPENPGLLWYYFELVIGDEKYYYGNNERSWGALEVYTAQFRPGIRLPFLKGKQVLLIGTKRP